MAHSELRVTMKSSGFWRRGFLGLALAAVLAFPAPCETAGALSTCTASGQSSASDRAYNGTDARSNAAGLPATRSDTNFAKRFATIAVQRREKG